MAENTHERRPEGRGRERVESRTPEPAVRISVHRGLRRRLLAKTRQPSCGSRRLGFSVRFQENLFQATPLRCRLLHATSLCRKSRPPLTLWLRAASSHWSESVSHGLVTFPHFKLCHNQDFSTALGCSYICPSVTFVPDGLDAGN